MPKITIINGDHIMHATCKNDGAGYVPDKKDQRKYDFGVAWLKKSLWVSPQEERTLLGLGACVVDLSGKTLVGADSDSDEVETPAKPTPSPVWQAGMDLYNLASHFKDIPLAPATLSPVVSPGASSEESSEQVLTEYEQVKEALEGLGCSFLDEGVLEAQASFKKKGMPINLGNLSINDGEYIFNF